MLTRTQGDIISLYLFGKSLDLISRPDFLERAEQMRSFTKGAWFSMHFPFVRSMMLKAPHWVLAIVNNAWVNVFIFCEDLAKKAIVQFDQEKGIPAESDTESIFERLLHANVRRQEKGKKAKPLNYHELADEGISSLNAGTEPTATMLAYATYFFLRYPEVQDRIMAELATVQLDKKGRLPLQQVENLPYFVRSPLLEFFFLLWESICTNSYRLGSSRSLCDLWFLFLAACHAWFQRVVFTCLQSMIPSRRAPWLA